MLQTANLTQICSNMLKESKGLELNINDRGNIFDIKKNILLTLWTAMFNPELWNLSFLLTWKTFVQILNLFLDELLHLLFFYKISLYIGRAFMGKLVFLVSVTVWATYVVKKSKIKNTKYSDVNLEF